MPRTLSLALLATALISGLIFPTLAAYTSVYVTLCAMLVALVFLSPRYWDILGLDAFKALWAAPILFAVTIIFTYTSMDDFAIIAVLIPALLAPGIALLLKEHPEFSAPLVIAILCFSGAAGACAVGLNDVHLMNVGRAGGGNNPIHFGGMAVIVGFTSLIGICATKNPWRYVFILGPVFGTAAAVLSGSRGPILAAGLLAIVTIPLLIYWNWHQKSFKVMVLVAGLISAGALTQINVENLPRALNVFGNVSAIYNDTGSIDGETSQRMVLYQSAFKAFMASPVFGYGSGAFAAEAGKFMPDEFAGMRHSQHLHSDLADFATIGGGIGILAYFSLLLAPLLAFRHVKNTTIKHAVLLGGIVLSVGYFGLGLTNAMFGVLPQTTLFGVLLGTLVGIAQSDDAAA